MASLLGGGLGAFIGGAATAARDDIARTRSSKHERMLEERKNTEWRARHKVETIDEATVATLAHTRQMEAQKNRTEGELSNAKEKAKYEIQLKNEDEADRITKSKTFLLNAGFTEEEANKYSYAHAINRKTVGELQDRIKATKNTEKYDKKLQEIQRTHGPEGVALASGFKSMAEMGKFYISVEDVNNPGKRKFVNIKQYEADQRRAGTSAGSPNVGVMKAIDETIGDKLFDKLHMLTGGLVTRRPVKDRLTGQVIYEKLNSDDPVVNEYLTAVSNDAYANMMANPNSINKDQAVEDAILKNGSLLEKLGRQPAAQTGTPTPDTGQPEPTGAVQPMNKQEASALIQAVEKILTDPSTMEMLGPQSVQALVNRMTVMAKSLPEGSPIVERMSQAVGILMSKPLEAQEEDMPYKIRDFLGIDQPFSD